MDLYKIHKSFLDILPIEIDFIDVVCCNIYKLAFLIVPFGAAFFRLGWESAKRLRFAAECGIMLKALTKGGGCVAGMERYLR